MDNPASDFKPVLCIVNLSATVPFGWTVEPAGETVVVETWGCCVHQLGWLHEAQRQFFEQVN